MLEGRAGVGVWKGLCVWHGKNRVCKHDLTYYVVQKLTLKTDVKGGRLCQKCLWTMWDWMKDKKKGRELVGSRRALSTKVKLCLIFLHKKVRGTQ